VAEYDAPFSVAESDSDCVRLSEPGEPEYVPSRADGDTADGEVVNDELAVVSVDGEMSDSLCETETTSELVRLGDMLGVDDVVRLLVELRELENWCVLDVEMDN
jgi:hypothetical protein